VSFQPISLDEIVDGLVPRVKDAGLMQSPVVLVTCGDQQLLGQVMVRAGRALSAERIHLGTEFARRLGAVPRQQRPLKAASVLRETVDALAGSSSVAFLDKIEILFDRSVRLDPIAELRRLARTRTIVAAWPGDVRDGRLLYAPADHPERFDYACTGFQVHDIS
jgi:hypothetical protein